MSKQSQEDRKLLQEALRQERNDARDATYERTIGLLDEAQDHIWQLTQHTLTTEQYKEIERLVEQVQDEFEGLEYDPDE